jgi:hypothetical protein
MEFALQETAHFFDSAGSMAWKGLRAAGHHLADHVIPHHRNDYHPHLLGHRTLALFSLLLIVVKGVAIVSLVAFNNPATTYASAITPDNIISLANQSRAEFGLKALTFNSQLAQAAQTKANDMLARQYFAHNTPDGRKPWDFIRDAGYQYLMAGENLAVDFTDADAVEQAWMNSPGHRANILNKNFEEIGIGISQGQFEGHNSIFVVQMFGTPAVQPVAVAQAPTKVEQPAPAPLAHARPLVKSAQAAAPAPAVSPVPAPQPETLRIIDASVKPVGDAVIVSAETSALAAKVVAQFGDLAVMLDPKDNNMWEASIPLTKLTSNESTVVVKAYDTSGNMVEQQLASFSKSTADNFGGASPAAAAAPASGSQFIHVLGHDINVKNLESNFYLIFIAGILAAMILAIGIKRHVQHLSLIANSSFVAVFALMLWMAG